MAVEVRAHIDSATLQERAVLRRTTVAGVTADSRRYCRRKAVSIRGHNGDAIRINLVELGEALRILKITPAELGYKTVGRAPKP
jgi:hypothetical protein